MTGQWSVLFLCMRFIIICMNIIIHASSTTVISNWLVHIYRILMRRGVGPGGSEGVGPPLESGIYRVKIIFKKISYLYGPPLKKICSLAPGYGGGCKQALLYFKLAFVNEVLDFIYWACSSTHKTHWNARFHDTLLNAQFKTLNTYMHDHLLPLSIHNEHYRKN